MFNKVLSLLVEVFVGVSIITVPCKYLDFNYLQFYDTVSCRERYRDLIKQCQMMHSSIGTGSLAYVVGSKVMDMRTSSKDEGRREAKEESRKASTDNTNNLENHCDWNNNCTDTSYECQRESSSNSADNVSARGSTDSGAYDSSFYIPTSGPCNCSSPKIGREADGSQYVPEDCFDFPHLPVTDLFEKSGENTKSCELHDNTISTEHKLRFEDDRMHSFQINNNVDLIIESNGSPSGNVSLLNDSEIEMVCPDAHESIVVSNNLLDKTEMINRLRISDVPETAMINSTSQRGQASEDRVSEWLWTLHRIGNSCNSPSPPLSLKRKLFSSVYVRVRYNLL